MEGQTTIEQNTRKAYIGYLGRIEWTHICTLTFRNPVSASTAWNRLKEWLSTIRVRYKRTVSWFAAVEVGEEKERHIHVLLQISPSVTSDALRSQWQAGISHIQKFDPNKPGIYYLTKTLDRDDAEYDLEIFTIEREESFKMRKAIRKAIEADGDWDQAIDADADQCITVEEASRRLSICKARCYELIRRQVLPAVHLGRQVRVDARALEEFLRTGGKTLAEMAQENS